MFLAIWVCVACSETLFDAYASTFYESFAACRLLQYTLTSLLLVLFLCRPSAASRFSMSATIALRTRRSTYDSRVQLISLTDGEAATLPAEPKTRKRASAHKYEKDLTESSLPTPPATPKRKRGSVVEKADDDEQDTKSPQSPAPRKSTPTKLRPKLLEPHPEPPRWRETYDIVRACHNLPGASLSYSPSIRSRTSEKVSLQQSTL